MINIVTDYNVNIPTSLCSIMEKYGSDKGQSSHLGVNHHNYTIYYDAIFKNHKDNSMRIFELGIGTNNINLPSNMGINGKPGSSLRGWKEYFHNSYIYGADIDTDILFEEDRIKTYYCDQLNPDIIKNMWQHKDLEGEFDIIIEDGLHNFEANKCFFENSFNKLKKGGVYIIEDIIINQLDRYKIQLDEWKNIYAISNFNIIILPFQNNQYDNCLIAIIKK